MYVCLAPRSRVDSLTVDSLTVDSLTPSTPDLSSFAGGEKLASHAARADRSALATGGPHRRASLEPPANVCSAHSATGVPAGWLLKWELPQHARVDFVGLVAAEGRMK